MNTLQTPQGYKACRVTIPQTGDVLTHALVLESCGIRVALQTRRAAPNGGMYLDAIARLEPEPLPVKGYDVTYPDDEVHIVKGTAVGPTSFLIN